MTDRIRILIADDHAIVHEGLQAMLTAVAYFEVVGAARDGLEAVELAGELQPHVILMDLVMPRMDGLEAIRQIRATNHQVRILLLTSFADDPRVYLAIKAGALGFLLKDTPREQLYQAIRAVRRGQAVMHPTIAYKIIQEMRSPPDLPLTNDPLTSQEQEALHMVARGSSKEDIAVALNVDVGTVAKHISGLLRKLHLANRENTALYALREGHAP